MDRDVVIVSYDERGFWHCDVFACAEHWDHFIWENATSDGFCTSGLDATEADAIALAKSHWPDAIVRVTEDEDDE